MSKLILDQNQRPTANKLTVSLVMALGAKAANDQAFALPARPLTQPLASDCNDPLDAGFAVNGIRKV